MYYPPNSNNSSFNDQPTQQNQPIYPMNNNWQGSQQGGYQSPLPVAGQFVQRAQPPHKNGAWNWYKRQKRGAQIGIGCGAIFLVLMLCTCSMAAVAGNNQASPQVAQVTQTVTGTTKPTETAMSLATATPTSPAVQPTATPVQLTSIQPTPTQMVSVQPTMVPTRVVVPTPTPVPTQAPVPVPTPVPTQAPARTGVNGNPWGYDFNQGNLIYSPPADFCNYFSCIKNFPNGRGYVIECQDGMYSKSGGIRGSCSSHGGDLRILYSH